MKIFNNNKIFVFKAIIPLLILTLSFVLCSEKIPTGLNDKGAKEIVSYVLKANDNPSLNYDVEGTIHDKYIELNVPYKTDITNLVPVINFIGSSITPVNKEATDFSNGALTYTVIASDKTKKDYSVILNLDASSEKTITSFKFTKEENSDKLKYDYICDITNNTISIIMPNPNDLSIIEYELKPIIEFMGKSILPGNDESVDFWYSNYDPVKYTVTAEDGTTAVYKVMVIHDRLCYKEISESDFTFEGISPEDYSVSIDDDINNENHKIINIDIASYNGLLLIPLIDLPEGATISPTTGELTNFGIPVNYIITAQDSTYMAYTVYVTQKDVGNSITDFKFLAGLNSASGLNTDVTGEISSNNISLTVPFGTSMINLVASFTVLDGSTVYVGATPQISGLTQNSFMPPVQYTVYPASVGQPGTYNVTVTEAPNNSCDITAFDIPMSLNPALTKASIVQINQDNRTINVTVEGVAVNVSSLVATFSTSGQYVNVGTTTQASGVTPNDFTGQVVYTAYAQSGADNDYTVTVNMVTASVTCDMTAFNIPLSLNPGKGIVEDPVIQFHNDYGNYIIVFFKYMGTNLTGLKAAFSHNGTSVTVNGVTQTSGSTSNDFSSYVVYRVHAQAGNYKDYYIYATIRETYISLLPNGQGSETKIPSPGSCSCCWYWYYDVCGSPDSNHYIQVDDPAGSPDYDSTYVDNDLGTYCNSDFRDLYAVANPVIDSSSQITKIKVSYRVKRYNYDTWARSWASIRTGNSTFDLPATADGWGLPGYNTWYNKDETWTVNPLYGTTWTYNDIVNLEIGIKLGNHIDLFGTSHIRCTQVYVDVYYIPPIPLP